MAEQYHLNCDHNEGYCDGSTCDNCEHGPLLPCPNPACDNLCEPQLGSIWFVVCPSCNLQGPEASSKAEAREVWNGLPRN